MWVISGEEYQITVEQTEDSLVEFTGTLYEDCDGVPMYLNTLGGNIDFKFIATLAGVYSLRVLNSAFVYGSDVSYYVSITHLPELENEGMDLFEINDECEDAVEIRTDGELQTHTFHDFGDNDWIEFEVVGGETYQIVGEPLGDSPADLVVEAYKDCETARVVEDNRPFGANVILPVRPQESGTYKVRVYNDDPAVFGEDVAYRLSVTHVPDVRSGAVVIVAGRDRDNDDLQLNIHNVTNRVYKLFASNEYHESRIHYIATDDTPNDDPDVHVDATATLANFEQIITEQVYNQVNDEEPLTIYMMSHGFGDGDDDGGGFYLDDVNQQRVLPEQLDMWLDELERNRPNVPINIIIDMCYAGSFIANDAGSTVSGRAIASKLMGAEALFPNIVHPIHI